MARTIDQRKINKWWRWKAEYDNSDMTIQEFAARHKVSVASAYWWFRQLRNGRFGDDPFRSSAAAAMQAVAVAYPQERPIEPMPMPPTSQPSAAKVQLPEIQASEMVERVVQLPEHFERGFVLVLPGGLRLHVDKNTADAVSSMLVGAIKDA